MSSSPDSQNFKDTVVYGWGRQILEKCEKTKEAASGAVTLMDLTCMQRVTFTFVHFMSLGGLPATSCISYLVAFLIME